jgi:CRP/FNR family transcriptional regulator, anaerobic regulatory protein
MGVFADRVERRFGLSAQERDFLERLESSPCALPKGKIIVREGDCAEQAFVLMSGWVMSHSRFSNGSHQVRRLHFAGDLLAMPSLPIRHHCEDLETLSDTVIAPFPKRMLTGLFELPRLAAIMYMFAQAERITSGDRLANLGGTPAKGRIAFLLLDILNRLRAVDSSATSCFRLHLTREQIAHVTGMTSVHASRMWCELIKMRLILSKGSFVSVLDEEGLASLSGYCDRSGDFDFEWLRGINPTPASSS